MWTIRRRLRSAGRHGLPGGGRHHGPYRYIPPAGYNSGSPLPRTPAGGYLDRFGNEWREGPAHGLAAATGFTREWDVQLSTRGAGRWGRFAKRGVGGDLYLNLTPIGQLSH